MFPGRQVDRDHHQIAAFVQPLIAAAAEPDYLRRGLNSTLHFPTTYFSEAYSANHIDEPEPEPAPPTSA